MSKIVATVANLLQAYPDPAIVLIRLATLKSATIFNAPVFFKLISSDKKHDYDNN